MACIACAKSLSFFGRRHAYTYARCTACGTIQLDPQPTRSEMAEAYRSYSKAGHYERDPERSRTINHNSYAAIADALDAHDVRGRVLDYGAGWGGLVELLIERGYVVEGLDLDTDMVAYCESRKLPVRRGELDAVEDGVFNALVMCVVFEHLVEHDAWLAQARRTLEPGGLLVTLQPTARFAATMGTLLRLGIKRWPLPELVELFSPPWHTTMISIPGALELFARHGFTLEEVRWTPSSRQPGFVGLLQAVLERINRVGWALLRERWPLQVCHTLVFRNVG
jgi:cyclopropane fatty-acyl-phospholipid synthase-like methyltransferase